MNIPPFLERLLLSNEAVFKNATLGLSGQNMVYVPPGKTAVILELSIEPFINNVSVDFINMLRLGFDYDNGTPNHINTIKRMNFMVQLINDTYSTYINFRNEFSFDTFKNGSNDGNTCTISFSGKKEPLFIYIDRSLYFNLIYPIYSPEIGADNTGLSPKYDTPDARFSPRIQNLPKDPISFYQNTAQDFVEKIVVNSPTLDSYFPVNHQLQSEADQTPQMEYLRYFNTTNTESGLKQPGQDQTFLTYEQFLTLPLINVKYALINKRPSDYGISAPTK